MKYNRKPKNKLQHGDLANSLVEIAIEYISKNKSTEFALRELASKLGVSHAAAYRHFKNKNALLEEIASRGFNKMNAFFSEKMKKTKSPLEDLGRAYVEFATSNPGFYRVMFAVDFEKKHNEKLQNNCQESFHALLNIFGDKNKTNASKAIFSWAMVHGLVMLILDGQISPPLEDFDMDMKELQKFLFGFSNKILN